MFWTLILIFCALDCKFTAHKKCAADAPKNCLGDTTAFDEPSLYQNQDSSEIKEESDDSGSENQLESEPVTPTSPGKIYLL
mgnify:CR=1 FL=1